MALKRMSLALAIVGVVTVGVPTANAAMAVFDGTMVGKAIEQLKEMKAQLATELEQLTALKEQVMFLNEITDFANDITDAIGELITIELPIPNILKMAAQIKSDLRCLMPDGLTWGITFTDLNLASICETSARYREALFIDQDSLTGEAFARSEEAWRKVRQRRDALLEDTAVRALALGDVQINQANEVGEAADQLQKDLVSAKTLQKRMHVVAQAQILQARTLAQQNEIQAQMLKLQAIAEIQKGLPPSKVKDITGVEDEE